MSDLDPMDARLREYAERWRAAGGPPPSLPIERLISRRHLARAWWLTAGSAAAVAAVIVGATQLVGDDASRKPAPPSHTVKPADVVPWAPLPSTHPDIPTTTTPASPDPAEAAGKPACRASDLRATTGVGVAMGTTYLTARLTLAGSEPCRLQGYPELQLMDQGRPVDIPLQREHDDSVYQGPVLVAPGQPAWLRLSWTSLWCTTPVRNDTIRLVLAGGFVSFPGFGGSPACDGTPGSGPTPIDVPTFSPARTRGGKERTAYADVQVSGDLDLTASPEQSVPFTVTLTSPKDLPLDPCPDYRILQTGDAGPKVESYRLNCADVPFKDGSGRPYLPAGAPVTFAMTTGSSGPGTYKLSWMLDTVDMRGVGGTLTVAPGPDQTGPTAPALAPADRKTVRSAVTAIQTFLDTWRRDGMVVAARRYFDAGSQPPSAAGLPRISYGKVVHAGVSSWESADHFTLEVELDLHFTANRFAWDEGRNDRFITVTRDGAGFRLDFATSP